MHSVLFNFSFYLNTVSRKDLRVCVKPRSSAPSDVASFPPIGNVLSLLDLVPSGSSNPPDLDTPGVSRSCPDDGSPPVVP